MRKIIGIDLGTTFSEVAYIDEHDHPVDVLNTESQPLTASAVWIDEEDNMVVGQLARDNAIAFPEDVITLAKRHMGQDVKLRAHGKEFTPQEVSAIILKKLKQDAERALGETVTDAVITVPAYFGAAETKATHEAGEMAGFQVRRVYAEPVAAALAFGYDNPQSDRTLLVYDLGGGTFDITLFDISHPEEGETIPRIKMRATGGDRQLGGADWDARIVDHVAGAFIREHGKAIILKALTNTCGNEEDIRQALEKLDTLPSAPLAIAEELGRLGLDAECVRKALDDVIVDPRIDPRAHQDLQQKAERGKIALARMGKTNIVCQHAGFSQRVELTRESFKNLTLDLLNLTETKIDQLLAAKGVTHEDIDEVLCVGGSTRMDMVRDMLQRKFPGRVNTTVQADLCVARGAARLGKLIEMGVDQKEVTLTSHAYGVCARDEKGTLNVYPVILKDQQLPCRSAKHDESDRPDYHSGIFYTGVMNQTRVVIDVYENDAIEYTDLRAPEVCRKIGTVIVENLPPGRPAQQPVYVTFMIDTSLQLTVEALDVSSGKPQTDTLTIASDTSIEGQKEEEEQKKRMKRTLADTEIQS